MRIAPVEGGEAAEGEGEAAVEGEAMAGAAAQPIFEPVAKRPRNRRAGRAGSIRRKPPEATAARSGDPVAGVGTVPSGPPALDAAGADDDARSGGAGMPSGRRC